MPGGPLVGPIFVGGVLRATAALTGYGPFASDDYRYVLEPAWRSIATGTLAPPSDIRSPLLAQAVGAVFRAATALGVDDPTWLVRSAYLLLGAYSLLAIPGVFRLTREHFDESAARTAAWLMAAHGLMAHLSTRALIEVVAVPPLVWGLWLATRAGATARLHQAVLAGCLLGAAALLRFQVGLIGLTVVGVLVARRAVRAGAGACLGGLACLGAQALLDLHYWGAPFTTPVRYVLRNVEISSSFGTAPWFTYLVLLLALSAPPATLALGAPLLRAARRAPLVAAPLAVFVATHSLVPHKEERFLFSVLPLFFVLLAVALRDAARAGRWSRRAVRWFWAVNLATLAVVTASDSQRAVIEPLREAHADPHIAEVITVGRMEVAPLYAGGRATLRQVRRPADLAAALAAAPPHATVRLVFARPPDAELFATLPLRCGPPRTSHGHLADRLAVWLNPGPNRRRAAKTVIDCSPG